jgi:hypothetical protein
MTRLSIALPCLLSLACAVESSPAPTDLMEGTAEVQGVKGLERLDATGPYVANRVERFRVHVDEAQVARLEWSASGGTLSTSGRSAEWRLPATATAQLLVRVLRKDGVEGTVSWHFAITPDASRPMTAQAALLTTPMPVLDGGSLEISGGACEVRYEGTTNNVAIAFTTATHPALMYGRWNGSTWAVEVVDALGFNTGGLISQHVSMQVEANGTPHLVYVRESTVMYATKVAGSWVRERVDSTATPYSLNLSSSLRDETNPSLALNGSTPSVLYITGDGFGSAAYRPAIATRTGSNAWTRAVVPGAVANTNNVYPWGDLAIDGSGRHLFPVADETLSSGRHQLVAWTPTSRASVALAPQMLDTRLDSAFASANRLLLRTTSGLFDAALAATFTATTMTYSTVEVSGSAVGDVQWSAAQGRPVLLHVHGGSLELVTPNAAGFWTYTQLGTTSGASAGLAVHPTTGEASICYQANNRIMFQ